MEVNKEVQLAEGWLNRQMEIVRRNVAEWPAYLKRAAGIADVPETAREAWDESNRLEEFLTEHIHVFELLSDEQITPKKAIESLACYRAGNVPALPESGRLEHGQGAQRYSQLARSLKEKYTNTLWDVGWNKACEEIAKAIAAAPPGQPQGSDHLPDATKGITKDGQDGNESAGLADRGEGQELICTSNGVQLWPHKPAQPQMSAREWLVNFINSHRHDGFVLEWEHMQDDAMFYGFTIPELLEAFARSRERREEMAKSDELPLIVECGYSNIGEEWWAEARHEDTGKQVASAKGDSRPEVLHNLADELENLEVGEA